MRMVLPFFAAIAIVLSQPGYVLAKNKHVRESVNASANTADWRIFIHAYDDPGNIDSDYAGWVVYVEDAQTGDWQSCDADYVDPSDIVKTTGSAKSGSIALELVCNDGLSDDFAGSEFLSISVECGFDGGFYDVFKERHRTTIIASAECTIHVNENEVDGTGLIIRQRTVR